MKEPLSEVRFFRFIETEIAGIPLVIARTGWSGQGGFELYLDAPSEGERLWDAIVDAGADLDLRPGCPNLIDRIETGLLSFGNDMTLRDNPIEAGLDRFFKMGKAAEYLGQKALEQIAESGPDKRMVRLVVPVRPSPTRAGPTPWKWAKQSAREKSPASPIRRASTAMWVWVMCRRKRLMLAPKWSFMGPTRSSQVKLRTTTGAPATDVPRCPQGMLCTILVSRKSSRPIAPPSRPLPEAL